MGVSTVNSILVRRYSLNQIDDKKIRAFLISKQIPWRNFGSEYRVIEELDLCQGSARIDIAIVNGTTWGIEIKGETDTLKRLPNQLKIYQKNFDFLEVACTENHLKQVRSMIPRSCGIMLLNINGDELHCKQIRKSKINKQKQKNAVVQLLWKNEALDFLETLDTSKGFKSKSRNVIWNRIVELANDADFYSYVNNYLRNRPDWRLAQQLL